MLFHILQAFISNYLSAAYVEQHRDKLYKHQLTGNNIDIQDYQSHYDSFIKLKNNVHMCDQTMKRKDVCSNIC